jgi:uncharacterized protein (TIGR03437 family)
MEGSHCYPPGTTGCNMQGLTLPVVDYTHDEGCSITGGFMYRGHASPGLRGTYIYGDYCSGKIWGLERQGAAWVNRLLLDSDLSISTFGEDSSGEIYVASQGTGTIYHIEGSHAPRFSAAGVVNPASFVAGLVPGSLGTVFAAGVLDDPGVIGAPSIPLPPSLSGVSVTVNNIPAPILALANSNGVELVNFQVPFEASGSTTVPIVVTRDGQSSASVDVPILSTQPGVYTTDGTQAIAVHAANYTLVTQASPLQSNEFAFVYAAGLGAVTHPPKTSEGAPVSPLAVALADVRISIANLPCDVPFAGLAPGLVGVYQVNFRMPAGAPSGSQNLVLTAGSDTSPPVKVPVQ